MVWYAWPLLSAGTCAATRLLFLGPTAASVSSFVSCSAVNVTSCSENAALTSLLLLLLRQMLAAPRRVLRGVERRALRAAKLLLDVLLQGAPAADKQAKPLFHKAYSSLGAQGCRVDTPLNRLTRKQHCSVSCCEALGSVDCAC
eukprot:GHRQ01026558.1.p2 GENE.GHRQ01026558.1~~GHRQ01026558.1.p2  ORF type:complete len:144 (+),score=31.10 GHRQ01026558.1:20-451(+)